MGPSSPVLIIEDEPDLVRGLTDALEFEGFNVVSASSGVEGIAALEAELPSCVLLDLMLPDTNGYTVCETLRQKDAQVPILILTAKSQEADKVRGLECGADDYVTKPFSVAELVARIRALLRRRERAQGEQSFMVGKWTVDLSKHALLCEGTSKKLTFFELELLKLLRSKGGSPVSREEILEKVWGGAPSPNTRTVDNFVVKLRRKLEEDNRSPQHLLTVYGQGYRLV